MKRVRVAVAVLVTGACLSGVVLAADVGASREADHAALRLLMTNVTQAINGGDLDKLNACFAKEFVFTAVDQTALTNVTAVKAFYDAMFRQETSPVTNMATAPTADVLTRFVGDDAGYCYGSSVETYALRKGGIMKMTTRWTAVVVKEAGLWKVAAVHTGVNFLDNPVLRYRTMSFWRKLGIFLHLASPPTE